MKFSDYKLERIRGTGNKTDMLALFNSNFLWTELYEECDDPALTEWELDFKAKKKLYHFVEAVNKKTGTPYYCILIEEVPYGRKAKSKSQVKKNNDGDLS